MVGKSKVAMTLATTLAVASLSASMPVRAETLWFQNEGIASIPVISQNFDPPADVSDSLGADDFVVHDGEIWHVSQVQVTGHYWNGSGPPRSVNVVFYAESLRIPGNVIKAFMEIPVALEEPPGNFLITLPKSLKFQPGRYWVSVQVNMMGTSWGWQTRTKRKGYQGAWKNPLDGKGTGCVIFRHVDRCFEHAGPDFMFALYGDRRPSQ